LEVIPIRYNRQGEAKAHRSAFSPKDAILFADPTNNHSTGGDITFPKKLPVILLLFWMLPTYFVTSLELISKINIVNHMRNILWFCSIWFKDKEKKIVSLIVQCFIQQ